MNPELLRRYLTERICHEGAHPGEPSHEFDHRAMLWRHAEATLRRLDLHRSKAKYWAEFFGPNRKHDYPGKDRCLECKSSSYPCATLQIDFDAWDTDDYKGWYDSVVVPELGG